MRPNDIVNVSYVNNQDEITIMYGATVPNVLTRLVLDESGIIRRSTWHGSKWVEFWFAPKETCDNYRSAAQLSYCVTSITRTSSSAPAYRDSNPVGP
ncbi:hypothetical protein CJ030_MR1G020853 [Morella rubra]|uniref:S-locus glycoprotein domain-containing protein n=1 Tax=Morella rubra TaxID=262757 RepID=A0A6A1WQ65_9ROSI|nr:hypothetical protein CJ030_MR1G020853 [Morella rubra]